MGTRNLGHSLQSPRKKQPFNLGPKGREARPPGLVRRRHGIAEESSQGTRTAGHAPVPRWPEGIPPERALPFTAAFDSLRGGFLISEMGRALNPVLYGIRKNGA